MVGISRSHGHGARTFNFFCPNSAFRRSKAVRTTFEESCRLKFTRFALYLFTSLSVFYECRLRTFCLNGQSSFIAYLHICQLFLNTMPCLLSITHHADSQHMFQVAIERLQRIPPKLPIETPHVYNDVLPKYFENNWFKAALCVQWHRICTQFRSPHSKQTYGVRVLKDPLPSACNRKPSVQTVLFLLCSTSTLQR